MPTELKGLQDEDRRLRKKKAGAEQERSKRWGKKGDGRIDVPSANRGSQTKVTKGRCEKKGKDAYQNQRKKTETETGHAKQRGKPV